MPHFIHNEVTNDKYLSHFVHFLPGFECIFLLFENNSLVRLEEDRQVEKTIAAREMVLKSVESLSDEDLNRIPEKGKWSIAQVLEHLYLIEMDIVYGIMETLSKDEYIQVNSKAIQNILDRTVKRVAPINLTPSNRFQTLNELKQKLDESRQALFNSISGISDKELEQKSFIHRKYGLLTIRQWITLIGYHEERHLKQIEEIKEMLKK